MECLGCRRLGLSRTALYKPTTDRAATDALVIQAINQVLEKRPRWGFWKCFERLHQDGCGCIALFELLPATEIQERCKDAPSAMLGFV